METSDSSVVFSCLPLFIFFLTRKHFQVRLFIYSFVDVFVVHDQVRDLYSLGIETTPDTSEEEAERQVVLLKQLLSEVNAFEDVIAFKSRCRLKKSL